MVLPRLLLLFVCWFPVVFLFASDVGSQPSSVSPRARFSADSFDWREVVPSLFDAAKLPEEQGLKTILEKSFVLRLYVAREVLTECGIDQSRCAIKGNASSLDGEVDKRIDEIVDESIFHQHKNTIVDYTLSKQPFPFSEIVAEKNQKREETYLILAFADHSYTVAQLQAKYGAPYDTDISQWYSVFKYRIDDPRYTSKAVFEVNPVDGSVLKVAISLKPKKSH